MAPLRRHARGDMWRKAGGGIVLRRTCFPPVVAVTKLDHRRAERSGCRMHGAGLHAPWQRCSKHGPARRGGEHRFPSQSAELRSRHQLCNYAAVIPTAYCDPAVKSHLRLSLSESQPAGRRGLFSAVKAPFAGAGVPERATAAVTASATSPRPGRMPPRRRAAGRSGGRAPRHG